MISISCIFFFRLARVLEPNICSAASTNLLGYHFLCNVYTAISHNITAISLILVSSP